MRIGIFGPADNDRGAFREAAEFLLDEANVERVIYLGEAKDALIDSVVSQWAEELCPGAASEELFLKEALQLAVDGSAKRISKFLAQQDKIERLSRIRKVPPAPLRGLELLGQRWVLFMHEKSLIDEEDLVNASGVVFGRSSKMELKQIGPRFFFTPGPLRDRHVAVLEAKENGDIVLDVFTCAGVPVLHESLIKSRASRLTVQT